MEPARPNGYADTAGAWASPEQMKVRLDVALRIGERVARLWRAAWRAGYDLRPRRLARNARGRVAGRTAAGARVAVHVARNPEEMSMRLLVPAPSFRAARRCRPGGLLRLGLHAGAAERRRRRDPRLVVIILRGALDGLTAVGPIGDPDYALLHGGSRFPAWRRIPAFRSTGFSRSIRHAGFRPLYKAEARRSLTRRHRLSRPLAFRRSGRAGKRLSRAKPHDSGWLNRAIDVLPAERGTTARTSGARPWRRRTAPLVMRGPAPVLGWAPQGLRKAGDDPDHAADRSLSPHRDPALGAPCGPVSTPKNGDAGRHERRGQEEQRRHAILPAACARRPPARRSCWRAGRAARRGAGLRRLGHPSERGRGTGQLANRLSGLDGAFEEFEKGLGERWKDTTHRRDHRIRPHRAHQRHQWHRITGRGRWPSSPAARSRADASSPIGRA